jgi:hypothetical protein
MPICPFCRTELSEKQALKQWNYSKNGCLVKYFTCSNCDLGFMSYYPNNALSYTIPKSPSTSFKVRRFLRLKGETSKEEIAFRLRLSLKEVGEVLEAMEKEGLAQKSP